MSALERGRLTICFHYGSGGGAGSTEAAAHQADHRKIAKEWRRRLKTMDDLEKQKAIPRITHDIANLASTASVTQGNVTEHVQVSVGMVNKWLPANLHLTERDITPAI